MKIFFQQFKKYRGFSILELMVVIAIIGIMTAVGFVSLQSARAHSRLKTAQREIASTIKLAQSWALEGKTQLDGSGAMIAPCGYGFKFDNDNPSNKYEIFFNMPTASMDCETMNDEADLTTGGYRKYNPPGPYKSNFAVEYYLNNGVVQSGTADPWRTEVYFTVPHARTFIVTSPSQPAALFSSGSTIGITLSFSGKTKKVTMNPGGYIVEEN